MASVGVDEVQRRLQARPIAVARAYARQLGTEEGGEGGGVTRWSMERLPPPALQEGLPDHLGASLEVITANFASTEIAGDLLNAVSVDPPRRDAFHDAFVVFARCFQTNKRGRRRSHR